MGDVERRIAYFSMEIAVSPKIPTYSGGLGILAGDTLKAAADMGMPMVGVTLLSEKGYFTQELDRTTGQQHERPTEWDVHATLGSPLVQRAIVQIENRDVHIQAWQHTITGATGATVPVLFLDTNLQENTQEDRAITRTLYGGDRKYRLMQEIVLGIGGVRMLQELGYSKIERHHMNEGHAALLALELFYQDAMRAACPLDDYERCMATSMNDIRRNCVFTTHTPVAAGHDKFSYDLLAQLLPNYIPIDLVKRLGGEEELNMTLLALNLSHYVNSVAKQHQHVSTHLFPGYHFSNITNGVHSVTWTAEPYATLFDRYMPNWRQDSFELRYALRIPEGEVWGAHQECKRKLVQWVNEKYNAKFDENVFTIGFARRATEYKRMDLLFQDIARLREIAKRHKIQIVFGGKAHPQDEQGKALIRKVFWHMGELRDLIPCVYIADYDMEIAKTLIPGVDIWLNTPTRPKEASGTSGMKAAHNGVPQISIQDGWWVEGHIEGITGWEIGPTPTEENESLNNDADDARELCEKLDAVVLVEYYEKPLKWQHVMRNAIAFNASFFNTHRMVQQYALHAYLT